MSIVMEAPAKPVVKINTFLYPISVPLKSVKGEKACGVEITEEAIELVNAVIGISPPLRFPERRYGGLTKAEEAIVTQRKVWVLEEALRLLMKDVEIAKGKEGKKAKKAVAVAEDRMVKVGLELAAIGVFRFGFKYKSLAWLADVLNARQRVELFVNKACLADPHYRGPRA